MARRRRAAAGDAAFFDRFRSAIARLPAGLIRALPPAAPEDVARAEAALGRPLPASYASFLRSFDGADLFHESIVIAGVGAGAPRSLAALAQDRPGELVFAEALSGDRFALDAAGRVLRYDPGADERAVAGSTFDRWLDATVAREQILFGPDGEYAPDVFDPLGQEIVPTIALRQAERALKVDPGAADSEHARGLALARLGRRETALAALARGDRAGRRQSLALVRSRPHGAGARARRERPARVSARGRGRQRWRDGRPAAGVGDPRRRGGRRRRVGGGAARGGAGARSRARRRPGCRRERRRRRRRRSRATEALALLEAVGARHAASRGGCRSCGTEARHPNPLPAPRGRGRTPVT